MIPEAARAPGFPASWVSVTPAPFRVRMAALSAVVLFATALLSACSHGHGLPRGAVTFRTALGPVTMQVEIADTTNARLTGLMHRQQMSWDSGMAFVWDKPVSYGFWMKDTLIPLSVAFWNRQGRIISILDMDPCHTKSCPFYYPSASYLGALEVNQEYFTTHGIQVGDHVSLSR